MNKPLHSRNRRCSLALLLMAGLIIVNSLPVAAQNQIDNLDKYWRYRKRLTDDFILISSQVEEFGHNLPGTDMYTAGGLKRLSWGDANNMMNHYLTMLATELWLLKNNEQDYQQTLAELCYAMLAIERLDLFSESFYRGWVEPGTDRNGLYNRDDVTPGFASLYKSHFGASGVDLLEASGSPVAPEKPEEISQDVMYHTLEGLMTVYKLVGTESIANVPATFIYPYTPDYLTAQGIKSGTNINFSLWAKDIIKRFITQFQQNVLFKLIHVPWVGDMLDAVPWVLLNSVTGNPVREGAGDERDAGVYYNAGLLKVGQQITGLDLRTRDPYRISVGEAEAIFLGLFVNGPNAVQPTVFGFQIPIDDGLTRSLGTTSNYQGDDTFETLRSLRDANDINDLEHLPLYNLMLYDDNMTRLTFENTTYNADNGKYYTLLDAAPSTAAGGVGPNSNHPVWGHSSRLIWPEKVGISPDGNFYEYNGLDYMVLHNLYYMTFRHEDFVNVNVVHLNFPTGFYAYGNFRGRKMQMANWLPTDANATYNAPAGVYLEPGFKAPAGSTLVVTANPRPNPTYNGTKYKRPDWWVARQTDGINRDINPKNEVYGLKFPDAATPFEVKQNKVAVDERGKERAFNVSPNPVRGTMFVNAPAEIPEGARIELLTITGQVLHSENILNDKQSIDVRHLSSGTYLVKFHAEGEVVVKKITVIN